MFISNITKVEHGINFSMLLLQSTILSKVEPNSFPLFDGVFIPFIGQTKSFKPRVETEWLTCKNLQVEWSTCKNLQENKKPRSLRKKSRKLKEEMKKEDERTPFLML